MIAKYFRGCAQNIEKAKREIERLEREGDTFDGTSESNDLATELKKTTISDSVQASAATAQADKIDAPSASAETLAA